MLVGPASADIQCSTLTVTMDYVNTTYEESEGTVWFDYFEIYGNLGDAVNSAEMPTGTGASGPSASSTSTLPSSTHSVNIGAIIGGVFGGVFLSLVLVLISTPAFLLTLSHRLLSPEPLRVCANTP